MDFAADDPFAKVPSKLREHYGFEIGESTIQRIALGHSQAIFEFDRDSDLDFPKEPGLYEQIVAETDGGMIPVMEPDAEQEDKRKGKTPSWREAKRAPSMLHLARRPGDDGEFDAERAQHRFHRLIAGMRTDAERLVQTFAPKPRVLGDLRHAARLGDVTERGQEDIRIGIFRGGGQIFGHDLVVVEMS